MSSIERLCKCKWIQSKDCVLLHFLPLGANFRWNLNASAFFGTLIFSHAGFMIYDDNDSITWCQCNDLAIINDRPTYTVYYIIYCISFIFNRGTGSSFPIHLPLWPFHPGNKSFCEKKLWPLRLSCSPCSSLQHQICRPGSNSVRSWPVELRLEGKGEKGVRGGKQIWRSFQCSISIDLRQRVLFRISLLTLPGRTDESVSL